MYICIYSNLTVAHKPRLRREIHIVVVLLLLVHPPRCSQLKIGQNTNAIIGCHVLEILTLYCNTGTYCSTLQSVCGV